ncbi:MAG TPA: 3-hydroxyacyl-CoA dehydrogenase family protein [Bacteroidales bacterium]|jgi:3-hydroxybutyryl-CoA dehydrogenase|nr:3-hydroxyacyl-CoA dehydrogenase family protein [Bacteroidales bacterium]
MERIGIIGEGKMGSGIFNYLLDRDFTLVWNCSEVADVEKIRKQFEKKLTRWLSTGLIDTGKHHLLEQTIISKDSSVLTDCDLLIEAIPENLPMKRELFARLDGFVKPSCIFTSNSSSINPSLISSATGRKGQFAGLHFFYPVVLKNIVELILPAEATPSTVNGLEKFLEKAGKLTLPLDEKNSFILNRIFLDVQVEAYRLVVENLCSYRQMDELIKSRLFDFGIFDFMDHVGIDTMLSSVRNYTAGQSGISWYMPLIIKLEQLMEQGFTGKKSGRGFYLYPQEETPVAIPQKADLLEDHLRQTWIASSRRYAARAHIPLDVMNLAICEYFGVKQGPFSAV